MKNKNVLYCLLGFLILICSSCVGPYIFAPYNAVYYEISEFPRNDKKVWDYDDETWLMDFIIWLGTQDYEEQKKKHPTWRDHLPFEYDLTERRIFHSYGPFERENKPRDPAILNKYKLQDEILCYAIIKAENESYHKSSNPYRLLIVVHSYPGKYTSFTLKEINIKSKSGEDFSYLINEELPITVNFKEDGWLVYGSYSTGAVFNLKTEPVILEVTLEVNGADGSIGKSIVFVFNAKTSFGLFQWWLVD
jgi:hypothetical protein